MRILVTGGAGFIGSNFIKYLLENIDNEIINLDKLTYAGNLENLIDIENNSNYEFVEGDICDRKLVDKTIERKDIEGIINFAAESHVDRSIDSAIEFARTNFEGTLNLLEIARDKKIKRFLQVSTDEVYGSTLGESFRETDSLNPNNPYAASKAAADLLCHSFFKTYNFPIIITRSTNNFGPYQYPEKFLPLMITNIIEGKKIPIYGTGENVRDWIYVEDNCRAIEFIFRKGKNGQIYNIAGKNELSNLNLAKIVLSLMNESEDKIEFVADRKGHDFRYSIDDFKRRYLGSSTPSGQDYFTERLKSTIDWYKQNESWWKRIKSGEHFKEWQERNYTRRN
ncbi:dTDP-glucose 4,6-dehydratase [Candidatus Pacearchaeota archaeon]|nr:dTDP-glucose 4,6-dehydratase [Candidatus Pacearchaeota archaeon]